MSQICANPHKPLEKVGGKEISPRVKNSYTSRPFKLRFFLRFVAAFFVFWFPLTVSASIFGLIGSILGLSGDDVPVQVYSDGVLSQNMALLHAAVNADPNPSKGGGEITMVGGVALLPESGPTGTIADIESSGSDRISIYVVRKGDTLSTIADMFDVTVNTVVWANNLTGSVIREGQVLVILPVSGVKHIVAKGETIQSIAKKYKGDAREIMRFNDIASEKSLSVGDEIIIPDGEVTPVNSRYAGSSGSSAVPYYDGYFASPLRSYKKTQGLHGYNGVDLAAPFGASVYAAAAGKVILSRNYGWNGGYGQYIVIQHPNGTQTLYSHLQENIVYEGASVSKGQLIGNVGSTGKSTGSHVHFEVRGARNPF
ncbi:MAG: hypothetical protein A3G59_01110 [Candidatus Taylorbacteria bacterium RIFCSPLOWO2_12_FULL_47_20]|uniref:LysM domain-containing protein n=2 Tax=Candidatus Tayloriibacteriota TaxID=1817919 RepID=A0A1G2P8V0_9BACT|nr:MAG: hypothetical protein A3H68_00410 [Candidatus Taylorbacteria bacterium RIFCSPLOWO2_02_FULL_46_40]OHA44750.1 MAG: hypothetical protein A3G59_01110 [Candidatus Taylorbacteria bacterium RIFCSPLOWO2_12_FULL_47_20]